MDSSLKQWVLFLMALCVLVPGTNEASPLKISLQSDQGTYFSRCNNCQKDANGALPDTVTTHVTTAAEPYSQFQLVLVGNGKVALKADNGKFVGRCNNCIEGGSTPDSVTVHVTDATPPAYAQFSIETLSNGKYALKADNGKYVARCNNCSPGAATANTVTAHATNPNSEPFAQWTIKPIFPPGTKLSFKSSGGKYISRCGGCQNMTNSSIYSTVTAHNGALASPFTDFEVVDTGNGKYAFKADNGSFVARCGGGCVVGSPRDMLAVHVPNASGAYSQFKFLLLNNGMWGIQADSGKYADSCTNCSPNASVNITVTVTATTPNTQANAQWDVAYVP
ncbi:MULTISPECIES: fascin domain-containing protein [unclassified Corallococcus]|uniref:fascin domain-containing protein n=1 Tax=unclassified Corallococcus TaxID=2685029 RepID=UPI001A90B2E9|nr:MULTISPECIES: hypothetical protein [unclassified Corallococcus]MBN9687360.1 hypothetical protein [Corallococcus sp. NCSPR001]WAS88818.1 hypothetical protein O0N60_17950 [Corallococcus sp. NCRR]